MCHLEILYIGEASHAIPRQESVDRGTSRPLGLTILLGYKEYHVIVGSTRPGWYQTFSAAA